MTHDERRRDPTRDYPLVHPTEGGWTWLCVTHDRRQDTPDTLQRTYSRAAQHSERRHT